MEKTVSLGLLLMAALSGAGCGGCSRGDPQAGNTMGGRWLLEVSKSDLRDVNEFPRPEICEIEDTSPKVSIKCREVVVNQTEHKIEYGKEIASDTFFTDGRADAGRKTISVKWIEPGKKLEVRYAGDEHQMNTWELSQDANELTLKMEAGDYRKVTVKKVYERTK